MQAHPEQHRKAASKDRLREAQRAWLEEIEQQLDITPTEIARLADVAAATVTRLRYKQDYNGTLSAAIVDRIAQGTGIAAPDAARPKRYDRPRLTEQPVASDAPMGLSDQEASPYTAPIGDKMARLVTAAVDGRAHVVPWTMQTRALEHEDIAPGDILIVDLNARPEAGDIVCVQIQDAERPSGMKTVFRLFHPPFLVGASRDEASRVPQLIDDRVGIKGVVELVLRRTRRAREA